MDRLDEHLGVNVGNLIGHSTVRYYVMGDESQKRTATDDEIKKMQDVVRDGIKGGALGLSVSRNKGHYDPQGVHIPALWADKRRSSRSAMCSAKWALASSSQAVAAPPN